VVEHWFLGSIRLSAITGVLYSYDLLVSSERTFHTKGTGSPTSAVSLVGSDVVPAHGAREIIDQPFIYTLN
jgi:hypothetical protein